MHHNNIRNKQSLITELKEDFNSKLGVSCSLEAEGGMGLGFVLFFTILKVNFSFCDNHHIGSMEI